MEARSMGSVRLHPGRGTLSLDYHFAGQRHRDYTSLPDTPANRAKLKRDLFRVERKIVDGKSSAATTNVAPPTRQRLSSTQ
jgi:hypothetical protein